MYQNDNGTISLTQDTIQAYFDNKTVASDSLFDGREISPLTAALSQIVGLHALCVAATFIALILIGKLA